VWTRPRLRAAVALLVLACGSSGGGPSAPQEPGPGASFTVTDAVGGLGPTTDLAFLPDGRMVILEKTGAVKLRRADGTVVLAASYDVDTESEKGLLGVAVDPAFATTRRLFLYWSASDAAGGTDLDRHRIVSVPLEGEVLDRTRERVLVRGLRGPANHDGGGLAIGNDGMLYAGVGDTGCNSGAVPASGAAPSNFFATCLSNANGKILRVALDGGIPPDNPLATVAAVTACAETCREPPAGSASPRLELWAWGFRNPWRIWIDPRTGNLWVGDVGERAFEEITIARAGGHHGWPWREGSAGWPVEKCRETTPTGEDCVEPAYACRHGAAADGLDGDCQSITGGLVVDTPSWPERERGRYYFADNANGRVWSVAVTAARDGVVAGSRREVARIQGGGPVSLRLGPDGDLYVAVLPGRIVRLAPAASGP
jgi:glucose/arabinose dehydrogenase